MGSSLSRSDLFILFSSHKITAGGDLFIRISFIVLQRRSSWLLLLNVVLRFLLPLLRTFIINKNRIRNGDSHDLCLALSFDPNMLPIDLRFINQTLDCNELLRAASVALHSESQLI